MNTERTSSSALRLSAFRALRLSVFSLRARIALAWAVAALVLAALTATASQAGMKSASVSGTGAVLALAAQIRTAQLHAAAASQHTPSGRALQPRRMLHSGALVGRAATAASVVPISGGVQTYDVNSPPPAFRPLVGYGSAGALNNSSTNPPVYINALTPTNLTPVWSADETFLIFSSNRTQTGGINADATDGSGGSRFHLWAISTNGGEAFQVTTSAGPANGGEFYPALSQNNLAVVFTSDAQSSGTPNLFALSFSYSALTASAAPVNLTPSATNMNPPASLTLRASTEAASAALTGFSTVLRPTFSPNDSQEIVFSAVSTAAADTNGGAGHAHLYFLYTSSGGFSNDNNVSYPGKLTDGPADDTDPAFAPDGSYIAFASTANTSGFVRNSNNAFGPNNPSSVQDPSDSQSLSAGTSTGGLRSVFLISGGLSSTGIPFGTVPTALGTGGRISRGSTAGFDDYGPAWSNFANENQYTNPTGNNAYLAFSRSSASMTAPHDIYYFLAATGVSAPTTETLTPETAAGGSNASIKLNTDDNAAETSAAGNVYEDAYPTWSPFLSIFSIAYSSNRTVTYNNPAGDAPVEVAASVPDGGAVTNSQDSTQNYSVGAGYAGLLVSQVLNLDPPTLLRFSSNEVVHVQAGTTANPVTGVPSKLAASGGQAVTLTVRLSDRESGIDDTGGPNNGPRVYVQIKDPDSKYQDSQNTEHKVFMKDRRFDSQEEYRSNGNPIVDANGNQIFGPQVNARLSQETSSTANGLLDVYNYTLSGSDLYSSLYYNPTTERELPSYQKYAYPSYGSANTYDPITSNIGIFLQADNDAVLNRTPNSSRGVHGGIWAPDATNNPSGTYIFVGKSGGGTNDGTNNGTQQPTDSGKSFPTGAPAAGMTPAIPGSTYSFPVTGGRENLPYPYSDPRQFIPTGAEYECQTVNPQFLNNGLNNGYTAIGDPTVTAGYPAGYTMNGNNQVSNASGAVGDYVDPYYLAGVDDQGAFSGGVYNQGGTDRPVANYMTTGTAIDGTQTTTTHPAEWLQLTKSPVQDGNGGVLYTVTWTTPISGSDFFVDVIAYDKATFPNIPSTSVGGRANWRIYDNVGGFSTNQSIDNNDILVVSDYALGQKFAGTTFGGRNTNQNLVPKLFGTESYLTDVDINILPDSVYAGIPTTEKSYAFNSVVQPFISDSLNAVSNPIFATNPNYDIITVAQTGAENGLGALSYLDTVINDNQVTTDGAPRVLSQKYGIWRILSRGPVPASLLNGYLPKPFLQPAIADPAGITAPAAAVLDAHRCVIWMSPYTGDVLADPGTIDDPGNVGTAGVTNPRPSTTSILTAFVQAGGRLCVTGQDVGSTLTQNGTVANTPGAAGSPNFLPDVLGATLVPNTSGSNVLAGTDNRITGNPFYDHYNTGNYPTLNGPIQGGYSTVRPNYPYQDNLVLGDADYGDSALSQIPATTLPIPVPGASTTSTTNASVQGQTDVLTPSNTAQVAMTYGSGVGAAMVFHNDPYNPAGTGILPNGGTGSRVVYAGFGLEGLSNDYYSSNQPNPGQGAPANQIIPFDQLIPQVLPRNPRSAILHNIVSFLRTGFVTGTITQTAGTGQGGGLGISGVTVYLKPITGTAPPTRAAFSALTTNNGTFEILGVEPGTYTLVAVKPGFQRAVSNSGVTYVVEGDTTATNATLTMTPQQPGNIAGTVHDAAGNPISGSTVTFTSQDNSVTVAATSANGSVTGNAAENYFIPNVPVTNYTGKASSPLNPTGQAEYTAAGAPDAPNAAGITVQPNTTVQPVNFTLTPILATISGTVTSSAGGAPVPGATVTLTDSTGTVVGTPAVTAADGTYTLVNVPATQAATTYTVTATAPGFAASTPVSVPNVYLGSVITGVNLTVTPIPPGTITGTVTYTPGGVVSGPVAGAIVTYTAPGGTAQTVTTDANGNYTIPNVPPATYTVSAIGPNNTNGKPTTTAATAQSVVVTSGSVATADFQVTPIAPSFSGTVVSAASGTTASKPLAGVTITVTDGAGNPVTTTPSPIQTAADGTYTTGPLAPGTYTLTATLPGYTASGPNGPATVQLGDVTTGDNFTLTAVPPGSITGTVKDSQGNPVAGATVTFNSTDGTVHPTPATTDASGAYVIPPAGNAANVPASTYTGTATGTNNEMGTPQYGSAPAQTVPVPAGGSATANFTLPVIPASVSGTVTDIQTMAAVSGATVTLLNPAGAVVAGPVTTGTNGAFSFTGINALQATQTYTVSVTALNHFPVSVPVVLSLGDALTGIAVMLNEQATLVGLVTDGSQDASGQPLPGVTITVTDSNGNAVTTTPSPVTTGSATATAPDGQPENYTATLLPGKYTITASKGSYVSQTSAVITLTNAAPARANFALVSSIGTLGGLVTDQNGTGLVSGATVTAILAGSATGLTFTTSASSSPGPDGQPLNYSGQLAQGTYTVTVTKGSRTSAAQTVKIVGGTFQRLDFTAATGLPALHTFPAGIQFVSTPYDYSALGFNGLFGALNTAPAGTASNGNRSNVAVWNPLTGAYALDPTAPADALRLGVGYWVYLKNPAAVTQQGAVPTGAFVSVSLGQGWNQIGVPSASASGIPISSLMFDNGTGGMITFAQASGPQYNLVTRPLYGYSGGTSYQSLSTTGVLTPWNGYWIYVNTAATLEIPLQAAAATPTTTTTTPPAP